jgi:hypothetical protein
MPQEKAGGAISLSERWRGIVHRAWVTRRGHWGRRR